MSTSSFSKSGIFWREIQILARILPKLLKAFKENVDNRTSFCIKKLKLGRRSFVKGKLKIPIISIEKQNPTLYRNLALIRISFIRYTVRIIKNS